MRLSIRLKTDNEKVPIEYRRAFLSYLKHHFEKSSKQLYEEMYGDGVNTKPFTFSVYLPRPVFSREGINIERNELIFNFSTSSYEHGIFLYNSITSSKFKKYPISADNNIMVDSIQLHRDYPINDNEVIFKTISPFVIRDHNRESNKDLYLTAKDDDFEDKVNGNIKAMFNTLFNRDTDVKFSSVKLNKVVVKHYKLILDSNHGFLKLSGNREDLKIIYDIGIGSRRSEGFGMLEVVG